LARIPIGERIRESRKERGITQSALAQRIGISPSYLNLIEHDKRLIGGTLLKRLADALEVDLNRLSGSEDARLAQDIIEITRLLSLPGLNEASAVKLVAQSPEWAHALLTLHRWYRDSSETALALSDRLSQDPALMELSHAVLTKITAIRSFAEILAQHGDLAAEERLRFSGIIASESDLLGSSARSMITLLEGTPDALPSSSPVNEVEDFIIFHRNHFPALEDAASDLRQSLGDLAVTPAAVIADRLTGHHGVAIRFHRDGVPLDIDNTDNRPVLLLDDQALPASARFHMARHLVTLELGDLLDRLTDDERLTSDTARARGRRALANYAAGALLFPYHRFLEAAEDRRYDIERLGRQFDGSVEQIAHRLVTLRRPGAEGVPFAFLRTDPAGNISKPFSIPGLRMPRFGGACPLWAIYSAFATPNRTVAQLATMPQGERYLFIAHSMAKQAAAYGAQATTYSIMLGCDASYGDRVVYGDGFASGRDSLATPVGTNCRSCSRRNCRQRAHPSIIAQAERGTRAAPPIVE
jgi:predicted transcriptional regulator/transcriptional regulator with XRE-family HTH domain